MLDLPLFIPITFALTTLAAVYCFYRASGQRIFLIVALLWLGLQGALALTGFYVDEHTIPPRFPLLIMPVIIPLLALFRFRKGRRFLDRLDLRWLTLLHTVRLPMALVMFWLFDAHQAPLQVTFMGWNYDILIGLTAPVMASLVFGKKGELHRPKLLLGWNLIGLATLLIMATMTLASLPTAMQSLSFSHPMFGILYFPYTWMPCGIFPLIFIAQLVALRRLSTARLLQPA